MVTSLASLDARGQSALQKAMIAATRRSAAGLSEMVGVEIGLTKPSVAVRPVQSLHSLLGGPEEEVVAICLGVTGEVEGHMALALSTASACELVDMLFGQEDGSTVSLDEMAESALAEAGNLTGSFFLNALADASGLTIVPTPPTVAVDMGGAILDALLAILWGEGEEVMIVETEFVQRERLVNATFLVIPSSHSLNRIAEALVR
ncbi:MAG: chemotaxis protein CheC [Chloroflexota bacterium]